MGKKRVNITIDEEVHKAAKEEGFNISKVCEDALKRKLELLSKGRMVEEVSEGSVPNNEESNTDCSEDDKWWARGDLNSRSPPCQGGVC